MSVDRLRAAADTQDDVGEGAAIAALLRAVADTYPCACEQSFAACRWHNVAVQGAGIVRAALALADVILGETE